jgi:hypothetical protein
MEGLYMGRMGSLIARGTLVIEAAHRFRVSKVEKREQADVELLDLDHAVLIVRPGVPEERWAA